MGDALMNKEFMEWLSKAIEVVASGLAHKLEKDGVIVYRCNKVIRIDIKLEEPS